MFPPDDKITNAPGADRISARSTLVTLAFLSHSIKTDGDILSGLVPLFAPLFRDEHNTIFDVPSFTRKVYDFYGLTINPYVVEELIPRLRALALLKRKLLTTTAPYMFVLPALRFPSQIRQQ